MADKETKLSIVIRAVDKATAVVRAISARIREAAAPIRAFGAKLVDFAGTGIAQLIGAFKRVGSVIGEVLSKIPLIGGAIVGAVGGAVAGLVHLVDGFDELGDKAEAMGVSVDFLAQMRYAAERSGAAVETLDAGMQGFSKSLGQARAGTGRMAAFLSKVSPALLKQLKAAKSNEAAFDLLADAMTKLQDPAKKAALAQATLGDASLAPLFAKGASGIKELRDRYLELAGSQQEAASKSGEVDDAMKDLKASTDGIKAALVTGLAPALKIVVERLSDWFVAHREDIAAWAKDLGDKLPGAIEGVVHWVGAAIEKLGKFFGLLGDIHAKIKEIWDANDSREQAKKLAEQVPEAQRPELARRLRTQGAVAAGGRRGLLSAVGGLVGLGGLSETDVGRAASEKALNVAGVSQGVLRNDLLTGKFQREMAAQLEATSPRPSLDPQKFMNALQGRPDISGQARDAIAATRSSSSSTEAKVKVEFTNAPRGLRVSTDQQSTADVDLSVGYQLAGGI